MKILALDTSTSTCVVGISEDDHPLAETTFQAGRSSSAKLLPALQWLLEIVGLKTTDLDAFGIVLGPGSFTGLRVGLSTIKGMAWALKKPFVGINALDVLVHQVPEKERCLVPMLDARKGRVYGAVYQWTKTLETKILASDTNAVELISKVDQPVLCFGEGARTHEAELRKVFSEEKLKFAAPSTDIPHGATLCKLSYEKLLKEERLEIHSTQPIYLLSREANLGLYGD